MPLDLLPGARLSTPRVPCIPAMVLAACTPCRSPSPTTPHSATPCAVGALLAFYIVRRRKRQRLADAELKGIGGTGMAEGELDDFIDVNSFAKPLEASVAGAAAAGGLGSYPDGGASPPAGTPTPATTSATSAAAGSSRWAGKACLVRQLSGMSRWSAVAVPQPAGHMPNKGFKGH